MSGDVRKGTIVTLMSATLLKSSAARFWVLPGLMVAIFRGSRTSSGNASGIIFREEAIAQTDSNALCARSSPVDSQHRRAMAHAAAELPELQNRASALSDLVPR